MREIHGKQVYDQLGEIVSPKHSALIVVDVQNDTFTDGGHASKTPGRERAIAANRELLPNMIGFVSEARKTGLLIAWIKNSYLPNWLTDSPAWIHLWTKVGMHVSDIPYCQEGTWGWEFVDEMQPLPYEPVVRKYRTRAFHGTFLDLLLKTNKIETCILIGSATHACVEETAKDCTVHDFYTVIVKDCCAPYDENLATQPFYDVATSEEIFKEWKDMRKTE